MALDRPMPLVRAQLYLPNVALQASRDAIPPNAIQYVSTRPCSLLKIITLDAPPRLAYVVARPQHLVTQTAQSPASPQSSYVNGRTEQLQLDGRAGVLRNLGPARNQTGFTAAVQATSTRLQDMVANERTLRGTSLTKNKRSCFNDGCLSKSQVSKKSVCKKVPSAPTCLSEQSRLYSSELQPLPVEPPTQVGRQPTKRVRTTKAKQDTEANTSASASSSQQDSNAADASDVADDRAIIAAKRYRQNEALMNIILSDVRVTTSTSGEDRRIHQARKIEDLTKCLDALEDDVDRMRDEFQVKLQAVKEADDLLHYKLRRFRELEAFIVSSEFQRSLTESELASLKKSACKA